MAKEVQFNLFFFSCRVMYFVSPVVFHSFSSLLIAKLKVVLQHSIMESVLIPQNIPHILQRLCSCILWEFKIQLRLFVT